MGRGAHFVGKVKRLEEKFSKQYITVESLKRSMTELKDTLAKSINSVSDDAKYDHLAAMMKQNSNAIQNISDTLKAVVAGQSKPSVQSTPPPKERPMQPQPVPESNGNNEECLMQHCFKIHRDTANREQAEQTCQADGGHLVMAKSADLYDFVVRMKNQVSQDDQFWFGVKFTDDRVWLYPDGTPVVDAVPWAHSEPNDTNNYKCSHIVFGNKNDPGRKDLVADAHCSARFSFICQRTTAAVK
ncbi:uncharacterized protein LOC144878841 isoform X2 [Branchiostoma floridae x Branchiostoma japonicum]